MVGEGLGMANDNIIRFCAFLFYFIIIMCVYGPTIICHWMVIIIACSCRFMCASSYFGLSVHFDTIFLFTWCHKFQWTTVYVSLSLCVLAFFSYTFSWETNFSCRCIGVYDELLTIYQCFEYTMKSQMKTDLAYAIQCTKRPFFFGEQWRHKKSNVSQAMNQESLSHFGNARSSSNHTEIETYNGRICEIIVICNVFFAGAQNAH